MFRVPFCTSSASTMPCQRVFAILVCVIALARGDDVTAACGYQEDAVTIATHHATAIFTGKVDSLSYSDNGDVTAVIIVKRVLKKTYDGGVFEYLNGGGKVRVRIVKDKASTLKVKQFRTGEFTEATIDLEPLTENLNCSVSVLDGYSIAPRINFVKKLRVKDTKIFLVRKLESRSKRLLTSEKQDAAMELDSPPLVLKLDMLDRVSAAVKGVGIVLITVSGVAWRLTAHDAPSCRMMLGLGGGDEGGAEPNRRFVPRLPPSYGRPHHPYAAMMYPEFQYRPPPPSYQASMQEYRLRLLLLDRHPGSVAPGQAPGGHAVSPPPTYRSHAGSTLRAPLGVRRDQPQSDYSRPPSYRSRTSSTRPTLDPNGNTGCTTAEHSRDPSLSLSDSGGGSGVVNVISVMGSGELEPEHLDTIKLAGLPADQDVPLRMMLNKGNCHNNMDSDGKEGNLVTIVQTGNDSSPVIVTVSGSTVGGSTSQQPATGIVDTEMEILAHL